MKVKDTLLIVLFKQNYNLFQQNINYSKKAVNNSNVVEKNVQKDVEKLKDFIVTSSIIFENEEN